MDDQNEIPTLQAFNGGPWDVEVEYFTAESPSVERSKKVSALQDTMRRRPHGDSWVRVRGRGLLVGISDYFSGENRIQATADARRFGVNLLREIGFSDLEFVKSKANRAPVTRGPSKHLFDR